MTENDKIIIRELINSYSSQLTGYRDLCDYVRKLLSRLILSRGDISVLMSGLEKKKKLMEKIDTERQNCVANVQTWQILKTRHAQNEDVLELNNLLEKTSGQIKDFLEEEEKLKKYVEGIIAKQNQI
jgi:hypothetical protein